MIPILLELRDSEEAKTKQTQTRIAQWNKNNDKSKQTKEKQQHTKHAKKNQKKHETNAKSEHQKIEKKKQQTIAIARTSSVAQKIS